MRLFRSLIFVILLSVAVSVMAAGETQYVTDQLVVSVRQAPNETAPPLDSLRSGQAVQVLAEEGRFFKVQLGDGRQGYVLKQYFTVEAPRRIQVAKLELERDALKEQLAAAEQKAVAAAVTPMTGDASLQQALAQAQQELADARARLEGQPQNDERIVQMQRELEQSRSEAARLEAEVQALREDSAKRYAIGMLPWFLAGAGVLLVGWMLGKSSRQKRRF